jgi:hypothetical protein
MIFKFYKCSLLNARSLRAAGHTLIMYNVVRDRDGDKWEHLPETHTCDGLGSIVLHSSPSKSHFVDGIRKAIAEGGFQFNVS